MSRAVAFAGHHQRQVAERPDFDAALFQAWIVGAADEIDRFPEQPDIFERGIGWRIADDGKREFAAPQLATTGLSGYTYPTALQNTTATHTAIAAAAGYQYCFSVRDRDAAGHISAWTGESCTQTPYDDRWLTASKGATLRTGTAWYRSPRN